MPFQLSFLAVFFLAVFSLVSAHTRIADEVFINNLSGLTVVPMVLPPPQQDSFHFNTTNDLPAPSRVSVRTVPVPDNCSAYQAGGTGTETPECPITASISAVAVTYDDCGTEFVVCRCSDAQMTLETALDRFGRIPVGLRRWVATLQVMGDTSPHAYTLSTGDIHMFGDISEEAWLHEATHTMDFAAPNTLSGQDAWRDAVRNDSCVPDNYAGTNAMEDFAQVSVIKIYSLLHDGELPPGFDIGCMQHQLDYFDTLAAYNPDNLFGNTCAFDLDDPNLRHASAPAETTTSFIIPEATSTGAPSPTRSATLQKVRASSTPTSSGDDADAPAATSNTINATGKNGSHNARSSKFGGSGKMTALFVAVVVWMCW